MPIAALGLFVVLSVESFKASARAFNRRRSRKNGYADLPTDSLGRPVNEHGERLTRNQARALTAHHRELERIRTAEREWRLEGERLPKYEEARDHSIRELLQRPSTGASSRSNTRLDGRTRATSELTRSDPDTRVEASDGGSPPAVTIGDGGSFSVRRGAVRTSNSTQAITSPVTSPGDEDSIEDILLHDGMDWRRATWEGSPIYVEREPSLPPTPSAHIPIPGGLNVPQQVQAA